MKRASKKVVSLLLALSVIFGIAFIGGHNGVSFFTANAMEEITYIENNPEKFSDNTIDALGQCGNNVNWTFDSATGLLTVSGTGAMYDYDIDESPLASGEVISVIIEQGVTSIGDFSFSDCKNMTSILIADTVTKIGEQAFSGCSKLAGIEIPGSVSSISIDTFSSCVKLANITVSADNEKYSSDSNGVLYNKNKTELIQYPIGNKRTSFAVPDGVTAIDSYAFYECETLKSVSIPYGVTTLDGFHGCKGLTTIDIPNSVTKIMPDAFSRCTSLQSVTIPDSVKSIEDGAFNSCSSLMNVTIGKNVTNIGVMAFYQCTCLMNVAFGESVENIGMFAFFGCMGLTDVIIPNSVKTLGDMAFFTCVNLKNVVISNQVTSIQGNVFMGCSNLESVTIPASVTFIDLFEFFDMTKLTIRCYEGSYADQYAADNEIPVEYIVDEIVEITVTAADGYEMNIDEDRKLIFGFTDLLDSEDDILARIEVSGTGASVEVVPTENGFGTGTKINIVVNGEIADSYTVIVFGDATGDSVIDESDFVMVDLYNAMLQMPEDDSPEFLGMDCTRDGVVDESDIVIIDLCNAFLGEIDQINGGIVFYQ